MADESLVLVDLLGETRGQIVDLLRQAARSVAELADEVGLSEVAIRRHLQVLERDGLIHAETVRRDGPGRPGARYALTTRGHRLFPDSSAALANEVMGYLEAEHGRAELLKFLRWRAGRQGERYASALADADARTDQERADALAELLSADGFLSEVTAVRGEEGRTILELRQGHCAIAEVAEEHPELCAFEAAMFQRVLGAPVRRRETIAGGAHQCVCHISTDTDVQSTTDTTGAGHGHES